MNDVVVGSQSVVGAVCCSSPVAERRAPSKESTPTARRLAIMCVVLVTGLGAPAHADAPRCFKYGKVVVNVTPRITAAAGEFCVTKADNGMSVKDGVFKRRWDARKAGPRRVQGRFRAGKPHGFWIVSLSDVEVWLDFSDGGDRARTAIRSPLAEVGPPIISMEVVADKPHGQWALLPGSARAHLGTAVRGQVDGDWRDAFGQVLGRYSRGRLVQGEPIPRAVTDGFRLVEAQMRLVRSLARLSPAERQAMRQASLVDSAGTP